MADAKKDTAEKMVLVDWVPGLYSENAKVTSRCNSIFFFNSGTQNVTIDNVITLLPNMGVVFEQYPGEINTHSYDIVFANQAGLVQKLAVYRKVYQQ